MEEQQREYHWRQAQSLELGLDLIAAARLQLRLLADVDSHPLGLYGGPTLDLAISRYENHWLPLLLEYGPDNSSGLPLIPPLDCAWIWHCHRLNPIQYIKDCKAVYGKILDPPTVPTGVENESIVRTRQIWDLRFPGEKYDFPSVDVLPRRGAGPRKFAYDLQAAVDRQSSFFYQVSGPHVEDERFLNAALQRYKGFLYLLKLSKLAAFLVPTYDIDLMWHSHQLCSGVYRDDTLKLFGRVLNHDDTDSDRSEGQKLDIGFIKTRELWYHTFGSSYEKAGAMYRGEPPTSPPLVQWTHGMEDCPKTHSTRSSHEPIQGVEARKSIQVCICIFEARNLRLNRDGVVAVRLLLKRKCSMLKLETSWLKWAPNTKWNDFWSFDCEELTEGLRLELHFEKERDCGLIKKSTLVGWTDISWKTLLSSSTLSFNEWLPLIMKSHLEQEQKPTFLRVCVSITPPIPAPFLFQMDHSLLKKKERNSFFKDVYDHGIRKSFIVEFKDSVVGEARQPSFIQVYGISGSKSSGTLLGSAARIGPSMTTWRLLDGNMHLSISSTWQDQQPDIQLISASKDLAMLLPGRKCQYKVSGSRQSDEAGYMTLVRQVQGALVGKATALFNWESGAMEISPDENGILVILLCSIVALAADKSHFIFCNRKPLHKSKMANDQNDWGAVVLHQRMNFHDERSMWFYPWYNTNTKQWLSRLYETDRGLLTLWKSCCGYRTSGCKYCDNECTNGTNKSYECNAEDQEQATTHGGGSWTGWSESGRSGCGMVSHVVSVICCFEKKSRQGGECGGCGKSASKADAVVHAGGCGACGAGGCGNSTKKANGVAQAGGCGGCGAGGCGNSTNKANGAAHAGGCGACGAGGCGNSISNANGVARAGGCGACGAGGCGNSVNKAKLVAVHAGGCGACGAGGCGNSVNKAKLVAVHAGGCGACGAGGCGNSLQGQNSIS